VRAVPEPGARIPGAARRPNAVPRSVSRAGAPAPTPQHRADAILELVDSIPRGRVMTYGDVAAHLGIPSARIVGQVLAARGSSVPWHRVVLSTGSVAEHLVGRQLSLLRDEGVDVSRGRVALRRYRWRPGGE
jgi:methylated-DNA-protein-cysteine methyltransferase-like protein